MGTLVSSATRQQAPSPTSSSSTWWRRPHPGTRRRSRPPSARRRARNVTTRSRRKGIMKALATCRKGIIVTAMASLVGAAPALAATFVYVSNAEDGDIAAYRMLDSGELQPGARTKAASAVMPMVVSPDRRFLYAASRSKPYTAHVYSINRDTGALTPLATAPLAESFPYISLDKTGRFLLGASYGGHIVSVNAIESDGRVAVEPLQVIPVGRNAHSI